MFVHLTSLGLVLQFQLATPTGEAFRQPPQASVSYDHDSPRPDAIYCTPVGPHLFQPAGHERERPALHERGDDHDEEHDVEQERGSRDA